MSWIALALTLPALAQEPPPPPPDDLPLRQPRPEMISSMATLNLGVGALSGGLGVSFGPAGLVGGRIEGNQWAVYARASGILGLVGNYGGIFGGDIGVQYLAYADGPTTPFIGGGVGVSVAVLSPDLAGDFAGLGFDVRLTGGLETLRLTRDFRLFLQGDVVLPVYLLDDGAGTRGWMPAVMATAGVGYKRW